MPVFFFFFPRQCMFVSKCTAINHFQMPLEFTMNNQNAIILTQVYLTKQSTRHNKQEGVVTTGHPHWSVQMSQINLFINTKSP